MIAAIVFAVSRWQSAGSGTDANRTGTHDEQSAGSAAAASGDDGRTAPANSPSQLRIHEYDADPAVAGSPGQAADDLERNTYGVVEEIQSELHPVIDPAELPSEILETGRAPGFTTPPGTGAGGAMPVPPPQGYVIDTSGPPPKLSDEVLPGPTGVVDALPEPGDVSDGSDMISPDLPGPGPGSGAQDPPGLGPGETPPDGN